MFARRVLDRVPAAMALALALAAACQKSDFGTLGAVIVKDGSVTTTWGEPVAGAAVVFVPATDIPQTEITAADVLSGVAQAYDEPLEDVISSSGAANYPRALTDATGSFVVPANVDLLQHYYVYVEVGSATPANLYPGGSLCRISRTGESLSGMKIELTGGPSAAATYVGSAKCLNCHYQYSSIKVHAHRLGISVPGKTGLLQDLSRKPDFNQALTFFKDATSSDFATKATILWFHSYDGTRGFDKFVVSTSDPTPITATVLVYLWHDTSSGKYKITMRNVATPTNEFTFDVVLTYGGALHMQRFMLGVPNSGYKGRYPFLQFQPEGRDEYYDRTRKPWRDYHMDYFWDDNTKTLVLPAKTNNIEANCLACHSNGYNYFQDTTGERMANAVSDAFGVFDLNNDGLFDEVNTGCETCHGPGSEHVNSGFTARFIVKPQDLPPGRENMICGRCHDRVAGNDDRKNEQPLNAQGEMAPPGIRRHDFLLGYTSRRGPDLTSFWDDEVHSKSHQQQYTDFIKSKHYRNQRRLVVCADCHDQHGKGAYDGELRGNPRDGTLCARCHPIILSDHVLQKTGSAKPGAQPGCTSCHFYKIAKSGAGQRGHVIGVLKGDPTDENLVYWENDISSHLPRVPTKANPGYNGKIPGRAMPIPYTNKCGTCHNPGPLSGGR